MTATVERYPCEVSGGRARVASTVPPGITAAAPVPTPGDAPLPCPFCGHAPGVEQHTGIDPGWSVYCASDNCEVYVVAGPCETRDAAVAMWNRRPGRV